MNDQDKRPYDDMDERWPAERVRLPGTGLDRNVASMLCYALGWVTGVIFLILEKDDEDVRFHALQSIATFGALTLLNLVSGLIPIFGWMIAALIFPVSFILWIVLMVKAYRGERFVLPWVGEWAADQIEGPRGPEDLH